MTIAMASTIEQPFRLQMKMVGWLDSANLQDERKAKLVMTFFKALIIFRLEYSCVLTSRFNEGKIVELDLK